MKLHNYQHRAIQQMTEWDKVILSVGMGLGKTAATLHYINGATWAKRLLIVAPKRVAETVWKQEAEKWGLIELSDKLKIVAGTKAKRQEIIQNNDFLIIGRDNLQDVAGMTFDILILDELTSFKNHESLRSQAVYSITARQKIGLTGTFLTNGAIDCFGQFCAVGLGNLKTKRERSRLS